MDRFASLAPDPEQQASNSEVRRLVEEAVEKLPDAYRTIFILRDIEDMSTTDAADVLEITEDNVKVRLHRAQALLRKSLYARAGMETVEVLATVTSPIASLLSNWPEGLIMICRWPVSNAPPGAIMLRARST
jgi:hypothetical protein